MCVDAIAEKCFEVRQVTSKQFNASYKSKTSYNITNNSRKVISKIDFDKCKGPNEMICDYLFIIENGTKKFVFVELKDSDVSKAIRQIRNTIEKYKDCLRGGIIDCRIVTTKTHSPDLQTTEYKRFKATLKKGKGDIITRSRTLTETI